MSRAANSAAARWSWRVTDPDLPPQQDNNLRVEMQARRQRLKTAALVAPHPESPDAPLPTSRMLKFGKVAPRGQCKWGYGDPKSSEFRFCGADCDEAASWCASHHRLVYAGFGLEPAL